MDQLICASLSHTHCWYEVGMLKDAYAYTVYISHALICALDHILLASYLGYIGIGSGNLGTSNPIVLVHGVVFGQIFYFFPRLDRIWVPNTMESRTIVLAVFDLTCRRVPSKVRSCHPVYCKPSSR